MVAVAVTDLCQAALGTSGHPTGTVGLMTCCALLRDAVLRRRWLVTGSSDLLAAAGSAAAEAGLEVAGRAVSAVGGALREALVRFLLLSAAAGVMMGRLWEHRWSWIALARRSWFLWLVALGEAVSATGAGQVGLLLAVLEAMAEEAGLLGRRWLSGLGY